MGTDNTIKVIRALVRPIMTLGLGAVFSERVLAGDLEGAAAIGGPFGIVVGFWFKERDTANGG